MARSYGSKELWLPGIVIQRQGPVSYLVQTERGNWKRHIDQLRGRVVNFATNLRQSIENEFEIAYELPDDGTGNEQGRDELSNQGQVSPQPLPPVVQVLRYPLRSRSQPSRPPDYLRY